jgi:hypothetical protein
VDVLLDEVLVELDVVVDVELLVLDVSVVAVELVDEVLVLEVVDELLVLELVDELLVEVVDEVVVVEVNDDVLMLEVDDVLVVDVLVDDDVVLVEALGSAAQLGSPIPSSLHDSIHPRASAIGLWVQPSNVVHRFVVWAPFTTARATYTALLGGADTSSKHPPFPWQRPSRAFLARERSP